MEMLLIIVGLLLVAWFLGFTKAVRTLANTANTEVEVFATTHKVKAAERLAGITIDEDQWTKAADVVKKAKKLNFD